MSVRVKICGITSVEDGVAAAEAGADAIGLVFYAPSPRAVSVMKAKEIVAVLPPFVTTVGLFVNASVEAVEEVLATVPLDLLQFHGDEPAEYCEQFARPWMKAVRMKPEINLEQEQQKYGNASALLVDAYRPGVPGGTGETFDWGRIPSTLEKPIVLAGGLMPENVAEAASTVQPWAVDVSGGVEQSRGIKSHSKVAAFIANAKGVR